MTPDRGRVVLASRSPRRRDLLAAGGVDSEVRPADVDETPRPGESPAALVRRLAHAKAVAVDGHDGPVLAADTVVALTGRVLGKPADDDEARRMLTAASGRVVGVWSGVAVRGGAAPARSAVVGTLLRFATLSPQDVEAYVATGEPRGVAGAFRIQGRGAALVTARSGCWTNVVGLPTCEAARLLAPTGVRLRPDDCAPGRTPPRPG